MNQQTESNLANYLRDGIIAALFALVWFLFDQRNNRNIYYTLFLGLFLILALTLVFLLVKKPQFQQKPNSRSLGKVAKLSPLWAVIILIVLFFTLQFSLLDSGSARLVVLVLWSFLGGLLFARMNHDWNPSLVFVGMLLLGGVLYRVGAFVNEVSSSPFALGWSEGSRIYNASLFFSEKLYDKKLPLPVLHPSRYLMQTVPFLFGIKSILVHRLWQVLLWVGMTSSAAWLMAKKLGAGLRIPAFWLSAFLFLFFFQGAVYYHLMVCVILMLIGYQKDKPLRILLFVFIASLWAGISRINWIPVPALLAIALYLLDEPVGKRTWFDYLKIPLVWSVVGATSGFASKQLYQAVSGENPAVFDSAFSSQLIWSRLFPNATFPLGILPAIAIVCLPLLVLIWLQLRRKMVGSVHWLRWFGLIGILGAFFAGGVLVSLKIGGGGDLHNLDAFLVFFALISLGILTGRIQSETGTARSQSIEVNKIPAYLLLFICFVPVFFAFMRTGRWNVISAENDQAKLTQIKEAIEIIGDESGPILFVTERQLLTMGEIEGVELVPDYEKVFLMEMAMGNNQDYLQSFYQLMDEHYFAAILMEPISTLKQASWKSFAHENNSYVDNVILPMLMDYQLALSWKNGEINLLIPNGETELMERLQQIQTTLP